MSLLAKKLRVIQDAPDPVRAAAILGAARHAEPDELADLCIALLATDDPAGMEFVIANAHRLGPGGLSVIANANSTLFGAVSLALASDRDQVVLNALEVIRLGVKSDLAMLIVGILSDSRPQIVEVACDTLIALAERTHWPGAERPFDRKQWLETDRALAAAIDSFRAHRCKPALAAAAMAMIRPGPAIMKLVDGGDDHLAGLLRTGVKAAADAHRGDVLVRWLNVSILATSAARTLEHDGHSMIEYVLSAGHLLRTPARRRLLRRMSRPMQLLPAIQDSIRFSADAQRHWPALISALGLAHADRMARLSDGVALKDPVARLAALSALSALGSTDSSAANSAVARFCLDSNPSIGRAALAKVIRNRQRLGDDALKKLSASPSRRLALQACTMRAASGVNAFFDHWMTISLHRRTFIARQLVSADRGPFVEELRTRLAAGTRQARLAALELARRLGLIPEIGDLLADLITSDDVHVASAVASALADGAAVEGHVDLICSAVEHDDARVAANAIEAASHLDRDLAINLIEPKLASRHNRTRANAILGLRRGGLTEAQEQLHSMLLDPDPLQRVSAIWVAARSRAVEEIRTLRRLAAEDRAPEIRERAAAAARLLNAQAAPQMAMEVMQP